jgi:16S rRNA processing protein RimM
MAAEALIPLGHLVRPHGLRGELRMRPYNPETTALESGAVVFLRRDGERQERRLTAVRRHKNVVLLTFEGCDDIDAAQKLVGCEVCLSPERLAPLAPGEVYHYELVGMRVRTVDGDDLGTVAEVMAVSSNDVLVVRDDTREHLIPLIADVVKDIDVAARCVLIDPIPGLLEI